MSVDPSAEARSTTTPPGGIMTREVGAITGDVELWIDPDKPDRVLVRYAESDDRYTVVGKAAGRGLDEIVSALSADPGVGADGNPVATQLADS